MLTAVGLTPCGSNPLHIYTKPVCGCVDTFVKCNWAETEWQ